MQLGCRSSLAVQVRASVHAWDLSIAAASAPVWLGMCVAFHLHAGPRVQELGLPVQNLQASVGSKAEVALCLAVVVAVEANIEVRPFRKS